MLDASKYAEHFPDETQESETTVQRPAAETVVPSPALLAALYRLEKEFSEILQAQQSEPTDRSE